LPIQKKAGFKPMEGLNKAKGYEKNPKIHFGI
jgi:hypothetical protein